MQKQVIQSFLKRYHLNISYPTGKKIFEDLLSLHKLLVQLEDEGSDRASFIFTSNIEYLDLLWHEMILNTEFYFDHCQKHFGRYLHHNPISEETAEANYEQLIKSVESQIAVLTQYLGEDFVHRIYCEYPTLCAGEKVHDF